MFNNLTQRQLLGWLLGFASALITFCIVYLAFLSDVSFLGDDEDINRPCQASSLEFQCYNITPAVCQMVWTNYAENCRDLVKARFGSGKVTALIGPSVKRCIYRRFDKTVRSSRKSDAGSLCEEHFKKLDAPTMDSFDSSR